MNIDDAKAELIQSMVDQPGLSEEVMKMPTRMTTAVSVIRHSSPDLFIALGEFLVGMHPDLIAKNADRATEVRLARLANLMMSEEYFFLKGVYRFFESVFVQAPEIAAPYGRVMAMQHPQHAEILQRLLK